MIIKIFLRSIEKWMNRATGTIDNLKDQISRLEKTIAKSQDSEDRLVYKIASCLSHHEDEDLYGVETTAITRSLAVILRADDFNVGTAFQLLQSGLSQQIRILGGPVELKSNEYRISVVRDGFLRQVYLIFGKKIVIIDATERST